MILTIDIGNSRIKWGQWQAGQLVETAAHAYVIEDVEALLNNNWRHFEKPDAVILACVADNAVEKIMQAWLQEHWRMQAQVFRATRQFGAMTHAYKNPEQHGADRWAAMIAARDMYSVPLCVISCGTAVTVDVIDAAGKHLGGQILPGADLMIGALRQRLPALAHIETPVASNASAVFASNTADAVACGVHNMLAAGLDRAAENARDIAGHNLKTLLTGGGATAMMALMKTSIELQPELVLRGLYIAARAGKT
ncbi:MAG: type III pantothenate kinase [Gammaproteobacteria bacterium]